jgi:DNA-binding transcriptional LysR family regulator
MESAAFLPNRRWQGAAVAISTGAQHMEMHQVRYFLAVARTLNFTRAADECNVAQPSLTRAVRQLEEELGGDLFRRERPHAQLTELGRRMPPLLSQCYESALGARSLASAIKSGEVSTLRIALSDTIDLALLIPRILELYDHYQSMEIKLSRGTGLEVADLLKTGQAELAVAASLGDAWDRLDNWPLFTQRFELIAHSGHRLAALDVITFSELSREKLLMRTHCEHFEALANLLRNQELDVDRAHEVPSESRSIRRARGWHLIWSHTVFGIHSHDTRKEFQHANAASRAIGRPHRVGSQCRASHLSPHAFAILTTSRKTRQS